METQKETHRSQLNNILPPPPKDFYTVKTIAKYKFNPYKNKQRAIHQTNRWTIFKNFIKSFTLFCK